MIPAELAVLRFGLGARPGELAAAAADPRGWLHAQTRGTAALPAGTALASSEQIFADELAARGQSAASKRATALGHYRAQVLARAQSAALTQQPFAERLLHFWGNHFAVSADKGAVHGLAGTLENEAVRPHVNGRFFELLVAAEQHPAMLAFLDNRYSAGADSVAALRSAGRPNARPFGINENQAREILELHTLGVNGGYGQADVTSFAQTITGWSIGGGKGRLAGGPAGRFLFRDALHEPAPASVLGKTYRETGQAQGEAVLADLARHPSTANHIATKLARHFIADEPPPAAVKRIAHAFIKSDGELPQVYAALIDSPEAWNRRCAKFKTPEDFVFSTLRALDQTPEHPEEVIRAFELLGQRQYTPGSPAGWADSSRSWEGSDALRDRIVWATGVGDRYQRGADPQVLAAAALGSYLRPETLSALRSAATGAQALALLFMSPEFQRR